MRMEAYHQSRQSVKMIFSFLFIFCCHQACLANDLFTCYKPQYATVGKQFKVNCSSSSNHWRAVSYKDGSGEDMIRCHKGSECNTTCSRKIGPRYEDGTQDIEVDGILLFTNVTEADIGNYTLEYTDCDAFHDSISFSLKEMVPVTTATETLPPSTTHVTTKSTATVTTKESAGASTTASVTDMTTFPEKSSHRNLCLILGIVVVFVVLICVILVINKLPKSGQRTKRQRSNPRSTADSTNDQPESDTCNSDIRRRGQISLQRTGGETCAEAIPLTANADGVVNVGQ